jgi:hypothetical protein
MCVCVCFPDRGGFVGKGDWQLLVKWFSPLISFDEYHTLPDQRKAPIQSAESAFGYNLGEIIEILRPP